MTFGATEEGLNFGGRELTDELETAVGDPLVHDLFGQSLSHFHRSGSGFVGWGWEPDT